MSLELLQWLEAQQEVPRVKAHFVKLILRHQKGARSTSSSMPTPWLRTGQIKDKPYQRCADTIPGAGEYFRCMSNEDYSDEQMQMWQWQCAWSKEHLAQHLQSKEPGWSARQRKQKKNK